MRSVMRSRPRRITCTAAAILLVADDLEPPPEQLGAHAHRRQRRLELVRHPVERLRAASGIDGTAIGAAAGSARTGAAAWRPGAADLVLERIELTGLDKKRVASAAARGEAALIEDDRRAASPLEARSRADELDAAAPRHHEVGDDQVGPVAARQRQRLLAVVRTQHLMAEGRRPPRRGSPASALRPRR